MTYVPCLSSLLSPTLISLSLEVFENCSRLRVLFLGNQLYPKRYIQNSLEASQPDPMGFQSSSSTGRIFKVDQANHVFWALPTWAFIVLQSRVLVMGGTAYCFWMVVPMKTQWWTHLWKPGSVCDLSHWEGWLYSGDGLIWCEGLTLHSGALLALAARLEGHLPHPQKGQFSQYLATERPPQRRLYPFCSSGRGFLPGWWL